jgi:VanZ family protein
MLSDSLIVLLPPAVYKLRPIHKLRVLSRWLFWLLLVAVMLLSVLPSSGRPVTHVPHMFEHVGIFLLLGLSFAAGYRVRLISIAGLAAFTGCVELLQFIAPGRHPRWSDFLENLVGIGIGIVLIYVLNRILNRFWVPRGLP